MKLRTIRGFLTAAILLLGLGGCTVTGISTPTSTPDSSGTSAPAVSSTAESTTDAPFPLTAAQLFSNDAGTSIDVLREEIGRSTAVFGVAYVGQWSAAAAADTGIALEQWMESALSPLAANYPFASEIDANHTIGSDGTLYCIIARDFASSISVSVTNSGELLYRSENGDPILLFAGSDDLTVSVTTADGAEYLWHPMLDANQEHPQLLIGDERELLFWDFTPTSILDELFSEGWAGPTDAGLVPDADGTDWWFTTADARVSYCLSFYRIDAGSYDGEVVLQCFYADDTTLQAEWQGWWLLETEEGQPSRLSIDMMLLNGADTSSFQASSLVGEVCQVLIHPSGDFLLLLSGEDGSVLPFLPEGVQMVELTRAAG